MRREQNKDIKMVTPLFKWRTCVKCNHEFKGEGMWYNNTSDLSYPPVIKRGYLCLHCAPNLEKAIEIYNIKG